MATVDHGCKTAGDCGYFAQYQENGCRTANFYTRTMHTDHSRAGGCTLPLAAFVLAVLIKMQDRQLYFAYILPAWVQDCQLYFDEKIRIYPSWVQDCQLYSVKKSKRGIGGSNLDSLNTLAGCRTANFTLKKIHISCVQDCQLYFEKNSHILRAGLPTLL
jgi:hypothetical protein